MFANAIMTLPLSLFLKVTSEDGLRNLIYRFCIGQLANGEDDLLEFRGGTMGPNHLTFRTVHPLQRNIVLLFHWSTRDFYRLVILSHQYHIEIFAREHWSSFHWVLQRDGIERLVRVGPLYMVQGIPDPWDAYRYGYDRWRHRIT
jgi:hypothetical protein